jgi:hypothetical protein
MNISRQPRRPVTGLLRWARRAWGIAGLLVLLAACSPDARDGRTTGGVTGRTVWPSASFASRSASFNTLATPPPADWTVRLSVSGPDFATLRNPPIAAPVGYDVVQGVPAGSGRVLTIEMFDGQGTLVFRGDSAPVTVLAGTTVATTVPMSYAASPELTVTVPGSSPWYSNAPPSILSGTCNIESTVQLLLLGSIVDTTACAPNGTYGFAVAGPPGTNVYTIQQSYAYNNTVTASLDWTWVFDNTPPPAVSIGAPTATSNTDSALFTGTCETGTVIAVSGVTPGATASPATQTCTGGAFSVTVNATVDGLYTVTLDQTDLAGNTSPGTPITWTRDSTAPSAPPAPVGTYLSSGGNPPTISVLCEIGSTVAVSPSAGATAAPPSGPCNPISGSFSFAAVAAADATYVFTITQTDAVGNLSPGTDVTWIRDSAPPVQPVISIPNPVTYSQTALPGLTATCTTSEPHTVTVAENGTTILSQACASSPMALTFSGAPAEAAYLYTVTQTRDATGVASPAASVTWIVDLTAQPVAITAPAGATATTNGDSLAIGGTCEPNATVNVTGAATAATTCTGGTFGLTVGATVDGMNVYTVTQTDLALNTSAGSSVIWTRDTAVSPWAITAPAGSTATTNASPLTITGTCEGTTNVAMSGSASGSAACSGGVFSFPATATVDGVYAYSFQQTDNAGNTAPALTVTWTFDTTAAPVGITQPTGGAATNANSSLLIAGTCEAGATIAMTGSASGAPLCSGAGTFSLTVTDSTATSTVDTYTFIQTDSVGNASAPATVTWTRAIPALSAPVITLPAETVPGSLTTYSKTGIVALSGTCTGTYTVTLSGAASATAACASGQFSFPIATPATDETLTYVVTQTDYAGTVSAGAQRTWVYDTTAPAQVALQNPTSSPVVTANTDTITISGLCEANATVILAGDSAQNQACSGGAFSFSVTKTLAAGVVSYFFSIAQRDLAGNVSSPYALQWVQDPSAVVMPVFTPGTVIPVNTANLADIVITGACAPAGPGDTVGVYLTDGGTPLPSQTDDPAASPTPTTYPYRSDCVPDGLGGGTFSINLNNSDAGGTAAAYWDVAGQTLAPGALPNGTHTWALVEYRSSAIDVATGDMIWEVSAGVFYQVIVNMTTPAAPSMTAPIAIASGATGALTAPGPLTISGGCDADNTVTLARASGNLAATCDAAGSYTFSTVDETTNGVTYPYALTQTSLAGLSSAATTFNWSRVAGFPLPVITTPAVTPYLSNQESLTIAGTCSSGLTVFLDYPPGTAAQSTPCAGGAFSFTFAQATGGSPVDRTFALGIYQALTADPAALEAGLTWHQDTTPPPVTVSYALPLDPALASSAVAPLVSPAAQSVFEFSTADAAATLQCNLDNAGWAGCTSPLVYTSAQITATPAVHSISIRAVDPAGNLTPTPYTRYWQRQSFGTAALYHLNSAAPTADSSSYNAIADSALTNNGTANRASGKFGQARTFASASSNHMLVGDRAHHATRTRMTVEMFLFLTADPPVGTEQIFASKWDAANNRTAWEFGIRGENNGTGALRARLFFRTYTTTAASPVTPVAVEAINTTVFNITNNAFQHFAVMWDRGTVAFYRNGTRRGVVTVGVAGTSLLPDGTGDLTLGATENGAGAKTKFFNGPMDEVRISQALCWTTATFTVPSAAFGTADCAVP